jgi:hypothetical protein
MEQRLTHEQRSELRKQARRDRGLPIDPDPSRRSNRSVAPIAKLLKAEGFDEYAAQCILHYAEHVSEKFREKHPKAKEKALKILRELDARDRKAIGKFISCQCEMMLQTGIRLGLMAKICS